MAAKRTHKHPAPAQPAASTRAVVPLNERRLNFGSINNEPQLKKIRAFVQSGVDEGARVVQSPGKLPERGYCQLD